jgi:hypothetical protein
MPPARVSVCTNVNTEQKSDFLKGVGGGGEFGGIVIPLK